MREWSRTNSNLRVGAISLSFLLLACYGASGVEGIVAQKLEGVTSRTNYVQDCPTDLEFELRITRPGCTYECYEFEVGKQMIFDKIRAGRTCTGSSMSKDDMNELYHSILSRHTCKIHFDGKASDLRICIGSEAVMLIMNTVAKSCYNAGNDQLLHPCLREGILRCDPAHTYPVMPEADDDLDVLDGEREEAPVPDPEKCIKSCTPEKKQLLYSFYQTMNYVISKRHTFLQKRINRVTYLTNQYQKEADRQRGTATAEVVRELEHKAKIYRRRIDKNQAAAQEILEESIENNQFLLRLEQGNPGMTWDPVPGVAGGATRMVAAPKTSSRANGNGNGNGPTCRREGRSCNRHFWKTNVRVNDECFSVCVSDICDVDFTFLYCFRISVALRLTDAECHTDVVTRNLCFRGMPMR